MERTWRPTFRTSTGDCTAERTGRSALVKVLNSIYEVDFLGFSYGFRPGRGPHDALDALTVGISKKR